MAKYICLLGKSSTGKDTIYRELLSEKGGLFSYIVPYTTRPKREGEVSGREYYFVTEEELSHLRSEGRVIEERVYHTVYGDWYYATVKDQRMEDAEKPILLIGTVESLQSLRKHFGPEEVLGILIEVPPHERLRRALLREEEPGEEKCSEICRRFLADQEDFSEEKLQEAEPLFRIENLRTEDAKGEILRILSEQKNYHKM